MIAQFDSSSGSRTESAASVWFKREVLPHDSHLRGYLRHRYPMIGDIDDIVQESYLRILRVHERGPVEKPQNLLFTIARNAAVDQIRSRLNSPWVDVSRARACAVAEDRPDAAENTARRQETELLFEAIRTLSPRRRLALELNKLRGLKAHETGAHMGTTAGTVDNQVAEAIKRCTLYFQERGLVRPAVTAA